MKKKSQKNSPLGWFFEDPDDKVVGYYIGTLGDTFVGKSISYIEETVKEELPHYDFISHWRGISDLTNWGSSWAYDNKKTLRVTKKEDIQWSQ